MRNTVFKIQPLHALLPATVALLFLSACGGGSSDTPAPLPPTAALSLFAGSTDDLGNQDGAAATARFGRQVSGLAVSPAGDVIIADTSNNAIRKLSASGQVNTLAGGGVTPFYVSGTLTTNHADGAGPSAKFSAPGAVAVDALGNTYVADTNNHVVRKIDATGLTTTLAGQPGISGDTDGTGQVATFSYPSSIAVDGAGNVYVAQTYSSNPGGGNPIRKITPAGVVSTVTTKASQMLSRMHFSGGVYIYYYRSVHLAVDATGTIYVADPNDHVVRKFNPDGTSTVLSGTVSEGNEGYADGAASVAKFNSMDAIALDHQNRLFVLDGSGGIKRIRQIGFDGAVSTVVQSPSCSTYSTPSQSPCAATDLAIDAAGNLIVNEPGLMESGNPNKPYSLIRRFTANGTSSSVVAGMLSGAGALDGTGSAARFSRPLGLAVGKTGTLYVADSNNNVIRAISPDGTTRTLGAPGKPSALVGGRVSELSFYAIHALAIDSAENLYAPIGTRIVKVTPAGDAAVLADLSALVNNILTHADDYIGGIAVDSTGNVYAAAQSGGAIYKINPKGEVSVLAGSLRNNGHVDGQGSTARFATLGNMAIDAADNLYVIDGADYERNGVGPTIRKITPAGGVSTLAGKADAAPALVDGPNNLARFTFSDPYNLSPGAHLAVDAKGNVYVTDPVNSVVRKIATADGQVSTLAGQPARYGFSAGDLPGMLNRPMGAVVRDSTLYVSMAHAVVQIKLP